MEINTSRRLIVGLVTLAAGLALAGCSSSPADRPQVATAQSSVPATSSEGSPAASAPAKESNYDKALKLVRCMNEAIQSAPGRTPPNGQKIQKIVIPDPVEGEPLPIAGRTQLAAFQNCKQFMPATWPIKEDPAEIAKFAKFRECMRKNGIYAPEPDANGMMNYAADPDAMYTPEYYAAERACAYLSNDPAVKTQG